MNRIKLSLVASTAIIGFNAPFEKRWIDYVSDLQIKNEYKHKNKRKRIVK